jgi:hypothetical protein
MFRAIGSLVACFVFAVSVYATAQYPDKIYFEGRLYKLHSNPMEAYFEKNPDKKPRSPIISTALWRGYVATFEIDTGGGLYLKDIEALTPGNDGDSEFKSVIDDVVPRGQRLKIDWFTGLLVLPSGEIVNYVHMGYGSTYEKYTLLEIAAGDFKRSKAFGYKDYEAFKERQFAEFKKTPEYKKYIEDARKEGKYDQKFMDEFLRNFVTDFTSKILVN